MNKCYCILVPLTVLCFVQCKDLKETTGKQVAARAMRGDFETDQWRAVQPHQMDSSGWVGTDDHRADMEMQPQKRRRLRKRKRRPEMVPARDESMEMQVRPRRRRPVRLDEVRDTWKELEAETPKRTYNRRRVSPVYSSELTSGVVSATVKIGDELPSRSYLPQSEPERIRRRKVRPQTTTTTNAPASVNDIKALLKQNGGMSLSEILQKRNLSLSDLLRGKQQAISALTENPVKQIEVVIGDKNSIERVTEKVPIKQLEPEKEVNASDSSEAQRNRIGVLHRNMYSDVTKLEVFTEPTTEKRIFVPSHPKYYTSLNFKQEFGMEQKVTPVKTTTESIETTTASPTTKFPKRLHDNLIGKPEIKSKLPVTSAKLLQSVKKSKDSDQFNVPPKAIKINIGDILGLNSSNEENETNHKEEEQIDQGPFKMLFDLEELVKQNIDMNTVIPIETTTKMETTTAQYTTTVSPTTTALTTTTESTVKPTQEKLKIASAKDEIMEILKDRDSKQQLSKILEVRNMTVDELVEQRERGSSQRHLADIFHNKTKEPEPVVEHIGEIKMEPNDRKGKTALLTPAKNVQPEIDIKSLPDVSISSEEIITSERIPGTSFPTYKIETNKRSKETPPVRTPIWKTIYPSVYTGPMQKEVIPDEIPDINEIENTISKAVNEELTNDVSKNNYDYDEYVQLPIGVKSAIFASLAIIGISLIVFLTILVIFKWAQRQKQQMCYTGGFSCSRIKSPILQGDSKRSIRTFMSETLGRKKSVYTSRLQSMSDSWESDKPYQ